MDASSAKIVVIDPAMSWQYGHNFAYNNAFQKEFARRGIPARFLFNSELPPEERGAFPDGAALLTWHLYRAMAAASGASPDEFRRIAGLLTEELRRFATPLADARTLVFCHTADPLSLYGIALWFSSLPAASRPALAVNLMLGMENHAHVREQLAWSWALLRDHPRVRLFGGTKSAAALLSGLTDGECAMLPSPLPGELWKYRAAPEPGTPLFGMNGDWRDGKNLHIVPPAVLRYFAKGGKGNFSIQLTCTDMAAHSFVVALHDISTRYPDRFFMDLRYLTPEEYYESMGRLSAVIIPYHPCSYNAYRPSGVIIESAAMGVPAICMRGGFMQEELKPLNNGSLFCKEPTAAALAGAFLQFEQERDERRKLAATAAVEYSARHSTRHITNLLLAGV